MNDQWTDRLSEYLDGDLAAGERAALEAHLAGCADCRASLDDLRRVVARAQATPDAPPRTDLWPGIHARLAPGQQLTPVRPKGLPDGRRPGVPGRRFAFSVPQLLAASVALALVSGGGVWLALQGGSGGGQTIAYQRTPEPDGVQAVSWRSRTDIAVAQLEAALAASEGQLDTATVRVVRQSLATIDRAIAAAERALVNDPRSPYLKLHLADAMRRKIELLRRANALAAAQS